jgi:hypothetical protein
VAKLAEVLKSNYDERFKKTYDAVKELRFFGFDQWMTILGMSVLEERFKFQPEEAAKMWHDVFEDTKRKPGDEDQEEYGPEIDA